jgi:hypothetical protein
VGTETKQLGLGALEGSTVAAECFPSECDGGTGLPDLLLEASGGLLPGLGSAAVNLLEAGFEGRDTLRSGPTLGLDLRDAAADLLEPNGQLAPGPLVGEEGAGLSATDDEGAIGAEYDAIAGDAAAIGWHTEEEVAGTLDIVAEEDGTEEVVDGGPNPILAGDHSGSG